jgi:hypothetical protein
MIPVTPQPEPSAFDELVRKPGSKWLKEKRIPLDQAVPIGWKWTNKDFWRQVLDEAHKLYGGCCAYLACHIELATGAVTIDHFQDKNQRPDLAYEWTNYRLASLGINRAKGTKPVLDPFLIGWDWFHLDFTTGKIFPNPDLEESTMVAVAVTIEFLSLDNARCRRLRTKYFDDYLSKDISPLQLERMNPFVFHEAKRQGLL